MRFESVLCLNKDRVYDIGEAWMWGFGFGVVFLWCGLGLGVTLV